MSVYLRNRARIVLLTVAFGLLVSTGTAAAQGYCTMEALAGTYAVEFRGSSTFTLGSATLPRHWLMASAPFIFAGWMTFQPDGSVNGEAWAILGDVTSGLTALPMYGELDELDARTCTAVLKWWGTPRPGGTPGYHEDRFVFVDNGREFRSMLMQSPSGSMAWTGRGHRLTRGPGRVAACRGPNFLQGDVLLQAETLSSVPSAASPAKAASILRLTVARDGSYSGMAYVKDPVDHELPVEGVFNVQPNCTVEVTLESSELPGVTQHGRGMIFDGGRSGFLIMPLEVEQTGGPTLVPAFAWCELVSLWW